MGLEPGEFLRTLPAAAAPWGVLVEAGLVRIPHPSGEIRIAFEAAPPRQLGALSLPVLRVEFDLSELGEIERRRFLRRFDLCFQRGGG